jgi:ribonuclease HI
MTTFYAVAIGRNPGVYTKWNECKINVEGFDKPKFKKFDNEEAALNFITKYSKKDDDILEYSSDNIYIYCDGACSNNGSQKAKAGIGIYISENNENNISEKLEGENLTNNIAELTAAIKAINILNIITSDIENKNKIVVTDSNYVILCATTYGEKLANKNWITSKKTNSPPPNVELVRNLYELTTNYNIKYLHIKAHTDKQDIHSIGNYNADKLANLSIMNKESIINKCIFINDDDVINNNITKKSSNKIYLNVPYSSKDSAKKKGALWDSNKKSWYILENNTNKDELIKTYKE